MSESTPAGIASRKIGKVPATWIIATADGEPDRSVTSQALATSRMKVPTLPRIVAAQSTAKTGCRNGEKAEEARAVGSVLGASRIRGARLWWSERRGSPAGRGHR